MDLLKLPLDKLAGLAKEQPDLLDEMPGELALLCSKNQNLQIFISFDPNNLFQDVVGIKNELGAETPLSLAGAAAVLADNICTRNLPTTCSSRMLSTYEPPLHARVAKNLSNQGALIAGKTNMEEFGIGSAGNSSLYGAPKNPWDLNRTAGHGAAAATATTVSFSLASDTCGEARQSASYCGVLSLKPTYGRISRKGIIDYAPSLAHPSIMARSTGDLALILEAVAGEDPGDPTSLQQPVPDYYSLVKNYEDHKPIRVAVLDNWDQAPGLEDGVKDAFQEQLHHMHKYGLELDFVSLQHFQESSLAAGVISAVEAFSSLANFDGVRFGFRGDGQSLQDMYITTRTEGFSSKLKQFLSFGALVSTEKNYENYYLKSQKMRTRIARELETCLEQYDLLLTPAVPFTAPLVGGPQDRWQLPDPSCFFTAAASLSGLPALTYPVYTAPGLPAGLQFMGRFGDEATLLKAALLLEKENPIQFPNQGTKTQGGCQQ